MMVAAVSLLAAGCSEKPQTATQRKVDGKSWDGAHDGYVAGGWKEGDRASWEEQIRTRAQSQNEYQRVPASARTVP